MTVAHIVQLPFPSTSDPDPDLSAYYRTYAERFATVIPEYFVPDGGLWELPLWVAHLTALLDSASIDSGFLDYSRSPYDADDISAALMAASRPGDLVLMSPLAQNFDLALSVSASLLRAGRRPVIGGNMAPLTPAGAAHLVHNGQLNASVARRLAAAADDGRKLEQIPSVRGLQREPISWAPEYRHLEGYTASVPLVRLNASHGCLYGCTFCGDAWSAQLTVVERQALEREADELAARFPDVRLVYIGDKTFGQSREAVNNLIEVFADRPGYRFIVQTHVMQVRPWVVEAMQRLGVVAVEMGFESADTAVLKSQNKLSRGLDDYATRIATIRDAGIHVVLNVMGGLDEETEQSHEATTGWMLDHQELIWLCNLYNFVPYPLIPDFNRLRPRIANWNFREWREDLPVVYTPSYLTIEASWELFKDKVAVAHRLISATSGRGSDLAGAHQA